MNKNLRRTIVSLLTACLVLVAAGCSRSGGGDPAGSATGEPGTWDQVVDLYEQAKEAGETTSKDAYEWVREDFHSIGDWQYRVVELPFGSAETLEQELNDLGTDRWECVWIEPRDGKMLGIFKRRTRTYLNRVPMGDLIKLVPKSEGDPGSD